MLRYINATTLVTMPLLLALCGTANAGIVVDIFAVDDDVHISMSGNINTNALGESSYPGILSDPPPQISPSTGDVLLGNFGDSYEVYSLLDFQYPFGSSGTTYFTSYVGILGITVGIVNSELFLPVGYDGDDEAFPIFGIAILANTNISNFADPGSYVTTIINEGVVDTFTINVLGGASVPEPSTAIAMGLLGIVGFAGNRRRRRQELVA
jgi:hypothetical protein